MIFLYAIFEKCVFLQCCNKNITIMIEYRDKENYCRWNGVLLDKKHSIELFGIDGELECDSKDIIIYKDTIYTNLKPGLVIKKICKMYEAEPITNPRYIKTHFDTLENEINGKYIVDLRTIKMLNRIKPYSDFKKEYPKFNRKKYYEFYKELDDYLNAL